MKKVIKTKNAPNPIGPYNQAIFVKDTLYISGQIAIDPITNNLITESIESETKLVLENLKAIVIEAGLSLSDVVKTSIFLNDMNTFSIVNKIYAEYFFGEFAPARETIAVKTLPKNVNVEISAIAVRS